MIFAFTTKAAETIIEWPSPFLLFCYSHLFFVLHVVLYEECFCHSAVCARWGCVDYWFCHFAILSSFDHFENFYYRLCCRVFLEHFGTCRLSFSYFFH